MKFEYPSKRITDSNVAEFYGHKNEVGHFAVGRQFNWHGGIHIEGYGQPIRAVADGVIVAYRVPDKYQTYNAGDGEYSNSFILIQHKYTSPQERTFIYYSLYMHLMSKEQMDRSQKVPVPFEDIECLVKNKENQHSAILCGCGVVDFEEVGIVPEGINIQLGNTEYKNGTINYKEIVSVDGEPDLSKYANLSKVNGRKVYLWDQRLEIGTGGKAKVTGGLKLRCKKKGSKHSQIGHILNGTKIELDTKTSVDDMMNWQFLFDVDACKIETVQPETNIKLGSKRYTKPNGTKYREILSIDGKSIKSLYNTGDKTVYIWETPTQVDEDGVGKTTGAANMRFKVVKYRKIVSIEGDDKYLVKDSYTAGSGDILDALYIDIDNVKVVNGETIVKGNTDNIIITDAVGANIFNAANDKEADNWLDFIAEGTAIELVNSTKKKFKEYEELATINGQTIEELYGENAKCFIKGKSIQAVSSCNLTADQLATEADPKIMTGDDCCIPVEAGTIVGHAGACDYTSGIWYNTSHVEVFSFDDPTEFIKGKEGEGESAKDDTKETSDFLRIEACTAFTLKYPSSIKLDKGDEVKVDDSEEGNYYKVRKIRDEYSLLYWVKKEDLKTNLKSQFVLSDPLQYHKENPDEAFFWDYFTSEGTLLKGDIVEVVEDGNYYKITSITQERVVARADLGGWSNPYYNGIVDGKLEEINKKFNGLLDEKSKLRFVKYTTGKDGTDRNVSFRKDNTSFWVKKGDVKGEQSNETYQLTEPIVDLYCIHPENKTDQETDQKILLNKNKLSVLEVGDKQYYFNNKNVDLPFGRTEKETKDFEKVSPHNWTQYGFAIQKKEPKKFIFSKDECSGSQFVKDAFSIMDGKMLGENGRLVKNQDDTSDGEINKEELLLGLKSQEAQQKLSRLICYHTSEWAAEFSNLKKEIEPFLDEKIDNHSVFNKKYKDKLKEDKERVLGLLEEKLGVLDFWTSVEVGQEVIDKQLGGEGESESEESTNESPATTTENNNQEQEEKLKFKADQTEVYHFHPIAFVEQMRKMHPDMKINGCICEQKIRAFLRLIKYKEGCAGEIGYETNVGGKSFIKDYGKNWDEHPKQSVYIERLGVNSDAAGAYQILSSTWDELITKYASEYGINDFSPLSQDFAALVLLRHKRPTKPGASFRSSKSKIWVNKMIKKHSTDEKQLTIADFPRYEKKYDNAYGDMIKMVLDGDLDRALLTASLEWASFPESPYGQEASSYTIDKAKIKYREYLLEEISGTTDLKLKSGFLKTFGYKTCCSIQPEDEFCTCAKKHIDLRSIIPWQTQFSPDLFGAKSVQNISCYRTSVKLLEYSGIEGGGTRGNSSTTVDSKEFAYSNNVIQMSLEENNSIKILTDGGKKAVAYIDQELDKGNPVILGVRHTYFENEYNYDNSTDHYITVVGRGCDGGKRCFLFYEVGTSFYDKGQHDENKLFVNEDFSLTGTPQSNTSRVYTVTQVRGNKKNGDFS